MEANNCLSIWTVYNSPKDYTGLFVARRSEARAGLVLHTQEVLIATTLEGLREQIPAGLHCMPRDPSDEPQIVECWF